MGKAMRRYAWQSRHILALKPADFGMFIVADDGAIPTPARYDLNTVSHKTVRGRSIGHERRSIDIDPQFFSEFADKRGLGRFAWFHMAPEQIPISGPRPFPCRPPTKKHAAIRREQIAERNPAVHDTRWSAAITAWKCAMRSRSNAS
jgi:hypothetical protein